jgi:hypothetical protein
MIQDSLAQRASFERFCRQQETRILHTGTGDTDKATYEEKHLRARARRLGPALHWTEWHGLVQDVHGVVTGARRWSGRRPALDEGMDNR